MRVLVVDIGGNSVKFLVAGQPEPRKFPSGPTLTPRQLVSGVKHLSEDWTYDAISIGYPGQVRENRIVVEPRNLGRGWVGFDFAKAFGVPVRLMNDAAMQALGSYVRGRMLFVGLGTGLGMAIVVDGHVVPMEAQYLPYKTGTYEDYLGLKALKRLGIRKWQAYCREVIGLFIKAFEVDDAVIGGGNVNKLDPLPPGCRRGDNDLAFRGGLMLWKTPSRSPRLSGPVARARASPSGSRASSA